jgi:hypothetical protein
LQLPDKKALKDIKEGNYKTFSLAKELKKYLENLKISKNKIYKLRLIFYLKPPRHLSSPFALTLRLKYNLVTSVNPKTPKAT